MPQIKPSILGVLFFIGTFNLSCQVTFFGDLYVGKNPLKRDSKNIGT
jgi:hypothetical protein